MNQQINQDLRHALDPVLFAEESLGIKPDSWQGMLLRSSEKRVILNCSRQVGKSTTAAIISLHRAVFFPRSLILLVSPSFRQSSELFRRIRDFLKNLPEKYELAEDNKLSLQLLNGSRVVSLPGNEDTIRGFSNVSLIIEDEASRVSDDLYRAIRPMLAVSQGSLVLMSTPFGQRGHFYEEWQNGPEWKKVKIIATQCPRISAEFLEAERKSLGEWWYRQEYCCEFVENKSQVFSHSLVLEALDDSVTPISLS